MFFAEAEEQVAAASSTEIADENILWAEAGIEEVGAIGFFQIE